MGFHQSYSVHFLNDLIGNLIESLRKNGYHLVNQGFDANVHKKYRFTECIKIGEEYVPVICKGYTVIL